MRCNPSYWLLGLVPIALLSWIAVQFEHENIQDDLATRARMALHRAGHTWAEPVFAGRDGAVAGKALDDNDAGRALTSVRSVWGVRVADDESGLVDRVDRFTWAATSRGDGRIELKGFVPTDELRSAVVGNARSLFPESEIVDQMKIARGAPDRDLWLTGAKFSLRQLAQLKRGSAELNALDLSIVGQAASSPNYRRVKTALASDMPKGVKLKLDKVTPPVAAPYRWAAKAEGGRVILSGYMPSDNERQKTQNRVKALFHDTRLEDASEIAVGEPDGFATTVEIVLEQLAALNSGDADLKGKDLVFRGEAADEPTATAVRRKLRLGVPQHFKVIEQIRYPRQEAPASGSGYVMAVEHEGGTVEVSGMVPSAAARAAFVDAVKGRFPNTDVNDRTQIVEGAPEGWQQCVVAGLAALPKLKTGKSVLNDRTLTVTGTTDDYGLAQTLPADVKAASGQTCEAITNIAFTGKFKTDLTWTARRDQGGLVTLEGEVPDEATRNRILDTAHDLFAGMSISDRMRIVGAPPEPWLSAARTGLTELSHLRRGEVSIDGKELMLKGAADSERTANEVRQAIAANVPGGFTGRHQIEILSGDERAADSCQVLMREASAAGTINFERASADLTRDSATTLRELAKIANQCPRFRIEIEGHTDAEGTDERNQRLSDRRAASVASFLAKQGVEASRLVTVGYGATRPIADNSTAEGRARNRRIEFTVKVN